MKKNELIKHLADRTMQSQKVLAELLAAIEQTLIYNLANGEETYLASLVVSVVPKPARIGRNPRTGVEVEIPAHGAVKVKVGKALKDAAKHAA